MAMLTFSHWTEFLGQFPLLGGQQCVYLAFGPGPGHNQFDAGFVLAFRQSPNGCLISYNFV